MWMCDDGLMTGRLAEQPSLKMEQDWYRLSKRMIHKNQEILGWRGKKVYYNENNKGGFFKTGRVFLEWKEYK
ncbi:MAG: hypothetical protein BAA00_15960 [Parageobacillus thermoglucosidasius]|nr:MAG: hypothetical protein BAA00_15960 [Parageobacillus thermoglucosidasius]RDE23393.1 hypothetical protein DV714_13595 [Parageobacillus thermoglucosidasius]RDE31154.1 hypothetical protein DV713_14030 [Parageobacillus thermoglucosidasius]